MAPMSYGHFRIDYALISMNNGTTMITPHRGIAIPIEGGMGVLH